MEKKKRRWGDRKDGGLLRDLDGLLFITPLIYPNRCDNEAYIRETIDLTNMNAYLKKKNESETEFPYTMFHIIVAGLVKTITLRPKMNRFIANKNFYQRNEVSMSCGGGAGRYSREGRIQRRVHPRGSAPSDP